MHHPYCDITERIAEEPIWWDEYAVPRYCPFSPDRVANIYATQVVLAEIACQSCGHRFKVAFSWDIGRDIIRFGKRMKSLLDRDYLHYGDPPNWGCCPAGPTMNSDFVKALEVYDSDAGDWIAHDPAAYAHWSEDTTV